MSAPVFTHYAGVVFMDSVRKTAQEVEDLLDLYQREHETERFNALWEARAEARGLSAIPTLSPITTAVRQLDPAIWGEALATAERAA